MIKKMLVYFGDVDEVDVYSIKWNLQFSRNNHTYRLLILICNLIVNGILQSKQEGKNKHMDFIDEQRMCRLYEKFILCYYQKEYKGIVSANASQIEWQLDGDGDLFLPVMQTDITLNKGNKYLIIDAKYYEHTMQKQYDKKKLHSNNMYQLFTYVKNKEAELIESEHSVSGMLLYAKTDELIQPMSKYKMSGNSIEVRTLDLNCDFQSIKMQLDGIVEQYFTLV